jgi:glyoxylase-like metal-dependent hydrolase (beta-lactamase superfamily II)
MALVTCPTASIGTDSKHDLRPAIESFPEPVAGNVFFCGFASEDSFGASSYLIVRPEGNVLVDSPRFTEPLVRRIEAMGGVRWMFLTHIDDVADHAKWRERFGCDRIMRPGLDVERPLGDRPETLAPDLLAIPTPGHTRDHSVLLHRNFLFTGDHLWGKGTGLHASRSVCWYSWEEQRRSVELLRAYEFDWILPGHGPRVHLPPPEMRRAIEALARRMAG